MSVLVALQAADGAVTVTPGVATLALTGLAPTVTASDHKRVTPGVATLTLTAFAPTVLTPVRVTPGVASLTLSGFAPTVTTGSGTVVSPNPASLVLTGLAPTVVASDHKRVVPGVAALTLATFAPTVSTTAHVLVVPGLAILVLTGYEPTVTATGAAAGGRRFHWLEAALDAPVVNHTLMDALVGRYGKDTARQIYFAQERQAQDSFGPSGKYSIAERPPQPVVMVNSRSPRPHSAKPAPPPPTRDQVRRETQLERFAADALRKMRR